MVLTLLQKLKWIDFMLSSKITIYYKFTTSERENT